MQNQGIAAAGFIVGAIALAAVGGVARAADPVISAGPASAPNGGYGIGNAELGRPDGRARLRAAVTVVGRAGE